MKTLYRTLQLVVFWKYMFFFFFFFGNICSLMKNSHLRKHFLMRWYITSTLQIQTKSTVSFNQCTFFFLQAKFMYFFGANHSF